MVTSLIEKAQTLDNTHKNTIHSNSLRFNQCKMINTEKSESQNIVTTTVKRLRDAAASAPTVQA